MLLQQLFTNLLLLLEVLFFRYRSSIQPQYRLKSLHNEDRLKAYPCTPSQIHLSLGDQISERYTSITVSFTIPLICLPDKVQVDVCYTKEGDSEQRCVSAKDTDIKQYSHTSTVSGELYTSDWNYHIQLQGLRGRSTYFYNIVVLDADRREFLSYYTKPYLRSRRENSRYSDFTLGMSSVFSFTTAPTNELNSGSYQTRIAFLGDLGQTENSTMTMQHILQRSQRSWTEDDDYVPITLAVCVGDMSYADSNQTLWDTWFNMMEPMLSRIPLQVAAGNHEIECDRDSHIPFQAYEARFRMPNRIANASVLPVDESYFHSEYGCSAPSVFLGNYDFGNAFYSFQYGLAHVIVLSSYSDTRIGSVQYNWLAQELARVNRIKTPWVIVAMHTQFYTTFQGHNNETQTIRMRDAMEDLFLQYRVNLIVSGHDHAYMRSTSMFRGVLDESQLSPVYIIVGEGGNKEGHVKDYIHKDPESWVASRDKTVFGFGSLIIINNTHLHWKWIMDESADVGLFADEIWLYNSLYHSNNKIARVAR